MRHQKEGSTMAIITEDMKVGDIARIWPQTLKIFAHYKVDLCCGSGHTLEFIAQKHGLNLGAILEQLNDVAGETVPVTLHT
jgi:iron-sulfur cluster repair protein YtfE (RIC family)